ncbi:MAG: SGNH/GDSL hydrolase family protein [Bdellovibrionales bacterium]|nr:SGNH/GDSL hydrolase family protein [Bdellovibrionales bacterium]
MKLWTALLSLIFITPTAWGNQNYQNQVFTDSQFTASAYGREVAKRCLNPKQSSGNFYFNSFPHASQNHFLSSKKAPRPQYTFQSTSGKVTAPTKTKNYYAKPVFEKALADSSVKRILIFLGVNNLSTPNSAAAMVDKVVASGKECVFGLPPLYRSDKLKLNPKILRFNRNLVQRIKRSHGDKCKIVDTSGTLGSQGQRRFFNARDGLHFSQPSVVAAATCAAFKKLDQGHSVVEPIREDFESEDSQTYNLDLEPASEYASGATEEVDKLATYF